MLKKFVVILLLLATSSISYSSTINEPGFTESLLASIVAGSSQWGGIATDSTGNVYTAASTSDVFKVTPGGTVSQFGNTGAASGSVLGLLVSGSTLFVGFESGEIFTMDLTQATPTAVLLASLGSDNDAMGMAIAPTGFGAFGGQLVVGAWSGVYVVNPGNGVVTPLIDSIPSSNQHPDVAFTSNGVLLATDYYNARIVSISDTGTSAVFFSGITSPEGIAIHPGTGDLYVATASGSQIVKVAPDGLSSSQFAFDADFSGGWFMSGIRFSADGTTLSYLADSDLDPSVYQIEGFPLVIPSGVLEVMPVPTLGLWALVLLSGLIGFMGLVKRRRIQ